MDLGPDGRDRTQPGSAPAVASSEDHYRCGYCERVYVVPSLARDCERKH